MNANCRQSCRRCGRQLDGICGVTSESRRQSSNGLSRQADIAREPAPALCDSSGCFNEDLCCTFYGIEGQCTSNASWMACNCRVTCGLCRPNFQQGSKLFCFIVELVINLQF